MSLTPALDAKADESYETFTHTWGAKHDHPHPQPHSTDAHKLSHTLRHWLVPGLVALWFIQQTIAFPLEHTLWDKMWPFSIFGHWVETSGQPPAWTGIPILILYTALIILGTRYAIKKDADLHNGGSHVKPNV